jgi:hypothetical protein
VWDSLENTLVDKIVTTAVIYFIFIVFGSKKLDKEKNRIKK